MDAFNIRDVGVGDDLANQTRTDVVPIASIPNDQQDASASNARDTVDVGAKRPIDNTEYNAGDVGANKYNAGRTGTNDNQADVTSLTTNTERPYILQYNPHAHPPLTPSTTTHSSYPARGHDYLTTRTVSATT